MSEKPTSIILSHTDFEMNTKLVEIFQNLTEINLFNYYLTNLNVMQNTVLTDHFYYV